MRYLIRWASPQTVGSEGVDAEDLNGPLDAEVMENAAHLQRQQVLLGNRHEVSGFITQNRRGSEVRVAHHGHVVQHAPVDASLIKVTLVLREADVVQPP